MTSQDQSTQTDFVDSLGELMEKYWLIPPFPTPKEVEALRNLIDTKKELGPSYFVLSEGDCHEIVSNICSQYSTLLCLRDDIKIWCSYWGGIQAWPETFELIFHRASKRGKDKVGRFIERVLVHELRGKSLLRQLQFIEGSLPDSEAVLRSLWSYQQEQVITLVQGITIIQTKLPILRRISFASDIDGCLEQSRDEVFNIFGL